MITLPLNSFRIPWNFSLSPPEAFWAPPLLPTSSLLPPKTHLQTPIFVGDEILQMGLPDTALPPFLGCFEKWHLSLLLPFRPQFSKQLLCLEENGQRNFVSQKERKKSENFSLLKHKKTPIPPLRRKPNWIVDFSLPFATQVREKKWSRIFFPFFHVGENRISGAKNVPPPSPHAIKIFYFPPSIWCLRWAKRQMPPSPPPPLLLQKSRFVDCLVPSSLFSGQAIPTESHGLLNMEGWREHTGQMSQIFFKLTCALNYTYLHCKPLNSDII